MSKTMQNQAESDAKSEHLAWSFLRSVHTTRVHGPWTRPVLTPVVTNTAREHGCHFDTRVHGPCPRPVNTAPRHG